VKKLLFFNFDELEYWKCAKCP